MRLWSLAAIVPEVEVWSVVLFDVSVDDAIVPEVELWSVVLFDVSVGCVLVLAAPLVEAVPATEPLAFSEPEVDCVLLLWSVLELEVLGLVEVLLLATVCWSSELRCAFCCELWSDVLLGVVPVEATELLWPVVSVDWVDCELVEPGLVLAVAELLLELGGVEDWSA